MHWKFVRPLQHTRSAARMHVRDMHEVCFQSAGFYFAVNKICAGAVESQMSKDA